MSDAPIAAPTPRKAPSAPACLECRGDVVVTGSRSHAKALFCQPLCRTRFHKRAETRGRALTALAQAWRLGRHTRDPVRKAAASFALEQMAALADAYNQEDAAAERANALTYVAHLKASGHRPAVDRRSRR